MRKKKNQFGNPKQYEKLSTGSLKTAKKTSTKRTMTKKIKLMSSKLNLYIHSEFLMISSGKKNKSATSVFGKQSMVLTTEWFWIIHTWREKRFAIHAMKETNLKMKTSQDRKFCQQALWQPGQQDSSKIITNSCNTGISQLFLSVLKCLYRLLIIATRALGLFPKVPESSSCGFKI